MTDFAVFYIVAKLNKAVAKIVNGFNILSQQMKHQPQRTFAPDSGQFRKLIHGVFKQFRWIFIDIHFLIFAATQVNVD
jgi:hypothetical protein